MSSDTLFTHPFGALTLRRWPHLRDDPLRAWDGADRYLLESLQESSQEIPAEQGSTAPLLILNDQCGALTLALIGQRPVAASGDSFVAHAALEANAADNGIELSALDWRWADQPLPAATAAMIRVPKELSLLEWQLAAVSAALPAGAPVWLAGMDKHLPRNLVEVLGRYLDQPQAGLGRHKARIFHGRVPASPVPAPAAAWLDLPEQGWRLRVDAGVFSRQQLDIGARFFLQHIPAGIDGDICDLGCGNGVVGMMALKQNPAARLWSCDESALALASARDNIGRTFAQRDVQFHLGNGLDGLDQQFDLILLNPPFHRGHAVDDSVARMLFRHARRQLKPGGVLRVIGNAHLDYLTVLRRQFGKVTQVARNSKFIIHDASL
ncbi:MAG: methyltransferase [Alcanivoracaceae bacterium]|nr:methyltransferase [Alcanivoracaceae bacterium]